MIAIRLEGRLGNQLFQYAFIYSAAKKLNTRFYIDKSTINFALPEYFTVKTDSLGLFDKYIFSISGFKNIFSYHSKVAFYNSLKRLYGLKDIVFDSNQDPCTQFKLIQKKTLYKGFFQSEDYFKEYKNDILKLFTVKPRYKNQFEDVMKSLPSSKKLVVIHIRRADYISYDLVLDPQYFHNAIKQVHTDDNYYIFTSDDIEFIRKEFDYISNKYISDNSEIIDFQFLSHADICILSNSSFSWWGAYLNEKSPQVIAPAYWLGKNEEIPVNIIPCSWMKLN
jgi:hypothetical protein